MKSASVPIVFIYRNLLLQVYSRSMPSGCEKVKLGLLRKQLSLGSLTRKISRSSQGSATDAEEEICIREVRNRRRQFDWNDIHLHIN